MSKSTALLIVLIGFTISIAFLLVPENYRMDNYILLHPIKMPMRYFLYYLGERLFLLALVIILYKKFPCDEMEILLFLFGLYVADYMIFFNDPIPGTAFQLVGWKGLSYTMFMGVALFVLALGSYIDGRRNIKVNS